MTKLRNWIIAIIAAGMIVGAQSAQAHCDSIDGPVAKAVQKALETGNGFGLCASIGRSRNSCGIYEVA
jgi:hypothetical protein